MAVTATLSQPFPLDNQAIQSLSFITVQPSK